MASRFTLKILPRHPLRLMSGTITPGHKLGQRGFILLRPLVLAETQGHGAQAPPFRFQSGESRGIESR
jgi:hypothetical protein